MPQQTPLVRALSTLHQQESPLSPSQSGFNIPTGVLLTALAMSGGVAIAGCRPCSPCRTTQKSASKCHPCSPSNPCRAVNPCAAKSPCAAKNCMPCTAKNPCAAKNPCSAKMNPCAVKRPASYQPNRGNPCKLAKKGEKLFYDTTLGSNGMSCSSCHNGLTGYNPSFALSYPHQVAMAQERLGMESIELDEMVQFCIQVPMEGQSLPWKSKELAALTAYVSNVQQQFASNPCAIKRGKCSPCYAKNPCAMKNPCAIKNPCATKNPCVAKSPCSL